MGNKNLSKLLRKDTVHKANNKAKQVKPPRPKSVPKVPAGAIKLGDIKAKGKINANFNKTNTMSEISLTIVNGSNDNIFIELTGGVLHPDGDGFQRLFVAGQRDNPSPTVEVPAGESIEVPLSTCCMDSGKSPPNGTVDYKTSTEEAPASNVTAAKNWMEARQAVANLEGETSPETKSFCLQTEFTGKPRKEQKIEDEIRMKANLSYVQGVCWGSRP